jgi:pilus assembly protein CpaB
LASNSQSSRFRALLFLGIAGLAALIAGFVVVVLYNTYQTRIAEASRKDPTETFIVSAVELHQGIEITENDLFLVEIAPKYLHLEGGPESNLFKNYEQVVGRLPRERVLPNEFIRKERLADEKTGAGLNALIPRGQRAIAVTLNGGRAVSGFLRPWDYVDVLVTFLPEDGSEPETHFLQQSVLVLAVGGDRSQPGSNPTDPKKLSRYEQRQMQRAGNTVTLSVSPEQAVQIAHAQALGQITLTLRNNADLEPIDGLTGVGVSNLFGVQAGLAPSDVVSTGNPPPPSGG